MEKTKLKYFKDGYGDFYTRIPISDNMFKEDDTGYLYCKNSILGHVGVQKYLGKEIGLQDEAAEQVIEMIRDEADVFNEKSLESFEGKPITLHHPTGKVDSSNYKKFLVGTLKDAKRKGDDLTGDIVLYDEYTIERVLEKELKDLSLGYRAKIVPLADGRYKQEDIVINHLAIVEEGRAERARIVDGKTVDEILEPKDFADKVHVSESKSVTVRVNEYDDETGEETTKEVSTYESKHSHYEKAKQALIDSAKKPKEKGENPMEKDFKYYMAELKDLAAYPKGEFRDSAYQALADDCKETLGTTLPTLDEIKENALAKSVGFRDSTKDNPDEEEQEEKTLQVYAKDEERFFNDMYRKMDDPEFARKIASYTGYDILNVIEQGGKL